MPMTESFHQRGGWWVITQSILMLAVIVLGVRDAGQWHSLPGVVLGGLLFLAGGILGVSGVLTLGQNRTPYPKPLPQSRLIQNGVYGLVRHPLYASVILASLGWALLWQSGPSLVTAIVLVLFFNLKAAREEQWLREKFAEYEVYQKRVRRLIPWIY
jgi:protein-S-isoprenylcysteine O-methyltransferase Ste14